MRETYRRGGNKKIQISDVSVTPYGKLLKGIYGGNSRV
jgi:hypothetical protein